MYMHVHGRFFSLLSVQGCEFPHMYSCTLHAAGNVALCCSIALIASLVQDFLPSELTVTSTTPISPAMVAATSNTAIAKQGGAIKGPVVASKSSPAPNTAPATDANLKPATEAVTTLTAGAGTKRKSDAITSSSPKSTAFKPQKRATSSSALGDASPTIKNKTGAPRPVIF